MPTKQRAKQVPTSIGAHIENVHIENKAAPVSEQAAMALGELAKASAAHAQALSDIANALKGAPATMQHGVYLSNVKGG